MLRQVLVAGLVTMAAVSTAEAQAFAGEVRGALATPTGEWNDEDGIESGWGAGVNLQAMFTPMLGVYAGWERFEFGLADDPEFEMDGTARSSGFRGGLQLALPTPAIPVGPFLRAGLFYGSSEVSAGDGGGSITFESDTSLGFEGEGGVDVPLGPNLSFTPAVLYRTHEVTFDFLGETEEVGTGYFALGMGLKLKLGL